MSGVRWEDPAPRLHGRKQSSVDIALLLRERPGQWALIGEYKNPNSASSVPSSRRQALSRAGLDAKLWEFTSRKGADGHGLLYARYIGPAVVESCPGCALDWRECVCPQPGDEPPECMECGTVGGHTYTCAQHSQWGSR